MDRGRHIPEELLRRRAARAALLGLAAAAAAAVLAGGGCGLFKPRSPETPVAPAAPCLSPTGPDNLVANILVHYGNQAGTSCYNSMVDTAFAFHPDPVDSATNPTPYVDWNQTVETRVNSNIASDALFLTAVFDSSYQDPTITTSPQTETRYYAYHVLFRSRSQADTTRYQGRAEIKFAQGASTFWSIVDWRDHSDGSTLPTWGRLRADHRVGF